MRRFNPWPSRIHYFIMAILFSILAVYGSLVPLDFRPLPINEALKRFIDIPFLSLGINSRADLVSNILLFIPIGYLWAGAFLVNVKNKALIIVVIASVIVCSVLFSISIEFAQLWFPPRTVSQNDILAESIGAAIGSLFWCFIGQATTEWVHSYTSKQSTKRKVDWVLEIYMIGFLFYHLIPLDITISSGEIVQKFYQGKIKFIPFFNADLNLLSLYGWFKGVVIFIPVGVFVSIWRTGRKIQARPLGICLAFGVAFSVVIEICQLFIYSRFTDTTDIFLGGLGVVIGVICMKKIYGSQSNDKIKKKQSYYQTVWPWITFSFLYSLFLIVVFCIPFDPIKDLSVIKSRYIGFFRVPFSVLYHGSEFNAISEILKKGLFFFPLGIFVSLSLKHIPILDRQKFMQCFLLMTICASVAVAIELLQIFLPPKVPDFTDVILCVLGSVVGFLIITDLGDWVGER